MNVLVWMPVPIVFVWNSVCVGREYSWLWYNICELVFSHFFLHMNVEWKNIEWKTSNWSCSSNSRIRLDVVDDFFSAFLLSRQLYGCSLSQSVALMPNYLLHSSTILYRVVHTHTHTAIFLFAQSQTRARYPNLNCKLFFFSSFHYYSGFSFIKTIPSIGRCNEHTHSNGTDCHFATSVCYIRFRS